jgi:hypothetical protein
MARRWMRLTRACETMGTHRLSIHSPHRQPKVAGWRLARTMAGKGGRIPLTLPLNPALTLPSTILAQTARR